MSANSDPLVTICTLVMYNISLSACYDHRNGKPLYKDITRERINWYVKVEQTDDDEEYEVLLGDISVIERR